MIIIIIIGIIMKSSTNSRVKPMTHHKFIQSFAHFLILYFSSKYLKDEIFGS